jgi:hypothetical protein
LLQSPSWKQVATEHVPPLLLLFVSTAVIHSVADDETGNVKSWRAW